MRGDRGRLGGLAGQEEGAAPRLEGFVRVLADELQQLLLLAPVPELPARVDGGLLALDALHD